VPQNAAAGVLLQELRDDDGIVRDRVRRYTGLDESNQEIVQILDRDRLERTVGEGIHEVLEDGSVLAVRAGFLQRVDLVEVCGAAAQADARCRPVWGTAPQPGDSREPGLRSGAACDGAP
jgi:hypothetical protein